MLVFLAGAAGAGVVAACLGGCADNRAGGDVALIVKPLRATGGAAFGFGLFEFGPFVVDILQPVAYI